MTSFPAIVSLGTATPPRRYSQEAIYNLAAGYSEFYRSDRIKQIFMNSDIEHRHLFFDIESFNPSETVDDLHDRYTRGAMSIGKEAIQRCLERGGLTPTDIDFVAAVSCTGYLCPGLSSLMIREFAMRNSVQRADLLGMGCAGAMPGLQRASDFVKANPGKKALVLTVEICSACYFIDDSLETVVGNAICADGAAALVIGMSDASQHPKIVGFETLLDPSYIHTVGFEQREGKLRIILSKDIRDIAGKLARTLINTMLEKHHLSNDDIDHWILHSGGRKVIDGIQREMGLNDIAVRHSKSVLKSFGNMSAPTVLFVLEEALRTVPQPGDLGLMLAMGPGLAIEGALLQW